MDKIWAKISGLFFAAVMTVTLANKTIAENDEPTLPDTPPAAIGEATEESSAPALETVPDGETEESAEDGEASAEEEKDSNAEETFAGETGIVPADDEESPVSEEIIPAAAEDTVPETGTEEPAGDGENASGEEKDSAVEEVSAGDMGIVPAEDEEVPGEEEISVSAEETAPAENEGSSAEKPEISGKEENAVMEESAPAATKMTSALLSAPMPDAAEPVPGAENSEITEITASEESSSEHETNGNNAEAEGEPLEFAANEVVLVGNSGTKEIVAEKDIVIKTAGLQHVSSLVSDGDVYIIGTGILLVDELDLLYGRSVYLESFEEIYGENGGTVALFILTGEKDGVKTYELVNGTYSDDDGEHVLPAVLDEEYELPAGTRLVVPEGGTVLMQCVNTLVEKITGENGETETIVTHSTTGSPELNYPLGTEGYQIEKISSAPVLTVSEGSSMEIRPGARIVLNALPKYGIEQFLNSPLLNVLGMLALEGEIKGGAVCISESGNVAGSGTFTGTDSLTVETRSAPITNLNADGAKLWFDEGTVIDSMTVTGDSVLRYYGDWQVNSLEVNDGTLTVYNRNLDDADTITVNGTASGNGTVDLIAGNVLLTGGSGSCSAALDAGTHLSYVFSTDEGILRYDSATSSMQKAPLIPLVGTASQSDGVVSIPVADAEIIYREYAGGLGTSTLYDKLTAPVDGENHPVLYICDSGNELSYQMIDGILGEGAGEHIYLVETYADGVYGYAMLKPGSTETVTASSVAQIVRGTILKQTATEGGSTVTNTDTSYTGSGVLGGGGAGSVSGGTRRLALSGSRGAPDDPEPDPNPQPDPQPDPNPQPDPDPEQADDFRIWTTENSENGYFELHIQIAGKAAARLGSPVKVRMGCSLAPGSELKPLYAVFRDADGNLRAFEAVYDPATGTVCFSSDIAGKFIIVAFDFEGEPFTETFYKALSELAEVKALLA